MHEPNPKKMTNQFTWANLAAIGLMSAMSLTIACKKKVDPPTADFTFTVTDLKVDFSFSGTGEVESYSWDFGDGESGSGKNVSHTYAAAGTYSVKLTVTNSGGEDSETKSVEVTEPVTAGNPSPSFGDADGAFVAINTVTVTNQPIIGELVTKLGASAVWFTDGSDFVDVGTVAVKQGSLSGVHTRNTNGTYSWTEPASSMQGFSDDGVAWTISGGGGHDAISDPGIQNNNPFPTTKKLAETSSTISGGGAYTLAHDGAIDNADSSFYSIYGPKATLTKRVGGSETSAAFSASEMATLGKGTAILQIASFKITSETRGTKKYYMILESAASKTVTVE